jgi:hypothetical protein
MRRTPVVWQQRFQLAVVIHKDLILHRAQLPVPRVVRERRAHIGVELGRDLCQSLALSNVGGSP